MFGTNWTATYFNSIDLSGPIVYTELLPQGININWGIGAPVYAVNADNFSARFTSIQNFEAAVYHFYATAESGIRVYIDNILIVDRFIVRPLMTDDFLFRMAAGNHELKLEYFAAVGFAAVEFQWVITDFVDPSEQNTIVMNPAPQITSSVVKRAIADAEALLQTNGPISAVDRIHTALHGYLREVCKQSGIAYDKEDSISRLLKLLKQQHPKFQSPNAQKQEIERILNAFGTMSDALNSLRNNASLAHANPSLLSEEDAMLAVNAARSILNYLDVKLK